MGGVLEGIGMGSGEVCWRERWWGWGRCVGKNISEDGGGVLEGKGVGIGVVCWRGGG